MVQWQGAEFSGEASWDVTLQLFLALSLTHVAEKAKEWLVSLKYWIYGRDVLSGAGIEIAADVDILEIRVRKKTPQGGAFCALANRRD